METDDAMLERPTPKDWKDVAYELRQALVLVMNGHATKDGETVREALYSLDFVEVETPILYKTTPEGARDYMFHPAFIPGKCTHFRNHRRPLNSSS